jgi:predicted transcriptional regulator of viral defense system
MRKKKDPIVLALARQKVMTLAELKKYGASGTKMKRMSEAGQVIPVGSGIYASASLDPFVAAVLATTKYYPHAVISGLTALQIHEMSQEYVDQVDVDVPRETSIRNKMLKVHRVPKARIIGVTVINFKGTSIRIYDRERSLCEAYRLNPAGPIFFKALKRYVQSGKINSDLIHKYDQKVKTEVLSHLRQEMASA